MTLRDVDVVNARAVEPQIDAVFVGLLAEMTREWLLSRVGPKVTLQVVRLGVPAPTDGALKRFLAGMGPNVDHQALLVREGTPAGRADVWAVPTVGSPMLREHRFGQKVGPTLADERPISTVQSVVLRQLPLLAERPVADGARKRADPEVAQLVLRQLDLLDEGFPARRAGEWAFPSVELVMHAKCQSRGEVLPADIAQEWPVVYLVRVRRKDDAGTDVGARGAVRRLFEVSVELSEARALLVTCRAPHHRPAAMSGKVYTVSQKMSLGIVHIFANY